jgi:predicted amidohydrolase YtcJ
MGQRADVVFTGGAVYTADRSRRQVARAGNGRPATAVAVRGERIIAVGDAADRAIKDLAGRAPR